MTRYIATYIKAFVFLSSVWLVSYVNADIYYIHNDHLGTPQVVTDQNQNVVWEGGYGPFGELISESGSLEQPIRFPGQYADPETGYYYNYYRDYDPSLGRYIQADPIGVARDYGEPNMLVALMQGIPLINYGAGVNHLYSYAESNPLYWTDPYGLHNRKRGNFSWSGNVGQNGRPTTNPNPIKGPYKAKPSTSEKAAGWAANKLAQQAAKKAANMAVPGAGALIGGPVGVFGGGLLYSPSVGGCDENGVCSSDNPPGSGQCPAP